MSSLIAKLHSLGLVEAAASEEPDLVAQLTRSVSALKSEISDLKSTLAAQARARAESILADAVHAGRLPPGDDATRAFWLDALERDQDRAVKALHALPANPVLASITRSDDGASKPRDLMTAQQQKLADLRARYPETDFATLFAKAAGESPELFK